MRVQRKRMFLIIALLRTWLTGPVGSLFVKPVIRTACMPQAIGDDGTTQ